MATKLSKAVERELNTIVARDGDNAPFPLVVTLVPKSEQHNDFVAIRMKGHKQHVAMTVKNLYRLMLQHGVKISLKDKKAEGPRLTDNEDQKETA